MAQFRKFEEERTPSSAELEQTSEGMRGMCVVSIVVCLEGDETELFADAAASEPRLRTALRDLATRCGVQGGDLVYNAEGLWTPSSADDAANVLRYRSTVLKLPVFVPAELNTRKIG